MLSLNTAWLAQLLGDFDGTSLWLPLALFLGTFASEDLTCVGAGLLVANGKLSFLLATTSCALGIFVSDLGLYVLGYAVCKGALRWEWVRARVPRARGDRWRQAFDRGGTRFLFASRFLPGTRLPVYLTAGAIGWSFTRFASILAIAAVVWTPILVGLAVGSGQVVVDWLARWGHLAWIAVPVAFLAAWCLTRTVPLLFTWRGRRLLAGRLRRLRHWEYWPIAVVYLPVVAVLLWEALRWRAVAPFTACNPGIPHGGMAMESKGDILDQLPQDTDGAVAVARYARLPIGTPLEQRLAEVEPFLAAGGAVLKPDVGERGSGVAVVQDLVHARAWLEACPADAMVQAYVDGPEFGVVWCRRPDGSGAIRSIARKVPPSVTGDGTRSLEDLILADPREVAMARFHLRRLATRLDEVPAKGMRVALGELGTHCRGAAFHDARDLEGPELGAALEGFMAGSPGLDFGRFDVRAPSEAAFRKGQGIRVLEFNGVTGEPAHVYQSGYPLLRGWWDLCAHWRAACARGAFNRSRGHRPTSAWGLLKLIGAMRRRPPFDADAALEDVEPPGPATARGS